MRDLPLALLFLAAGCAAQPDPPDRAEILVPMDHSSGHIVVEVYLGDHGPYRFQLDTGAGLQACIDPELVRDLRLEVVGQVRNQDGNGDKTVTRDLVRLDAVRLGDFRTTGVNAMVADFSWLSANDEPPVHGLLGFELLEDFLFSIDYSESRLVLATGHLSPTDAHVVSYRLRGGAPFIQVKSGGGTIDALLDTGSRDGLTVPADTAERLGVGVLTPVGRARTVNSDFEVLQGTLPKDLLLAGHRI